MSMTLLEGYAALFGVADQAGDVVRAGAFAASLRDRSAPLPLLLEHDAGLLAGRWFDAREDGRGLFVLGEIDPALPGAERALRALADGVDGLSIGFVPLASQPQGEGRLLIEIELLEVSIVAHPMQPHARLNLARDLTRAA